MRHPRRVRKEESEEDAVLVVGVSWRRDGDDVNI